MFVFDFVFNLKFINEKGNDDISMDHTGIQSMQLSTISYVSMCMKQSRQETIRCCNNLEEHETLGK